MAEEDLDRRIERAEKNWQSATQGAPGDKTWGFYSYGDAPAGIGGGFGVFVWFPDRAAMLDFIADTLPYVQPGQSDKDWGEVAGQTEAIAQELKDGTTDDTAGIERLNRALVTFSQIEWMGTFDQLAASNETFPAAVRASFFDEDSTEELQPETADARDAVDPIPADRLQEFREFLLDWGI